MCLEKFVAAAGESVFVHSPQVFESPQEIDLTVEDFVSGLVQYLFNECAHGMCGREGGYSPFDKALDPRVAGPGSPSASGALEGVHPEWIGLAVIGGYGIGAGVYAVPSTLYHFTTTAAAEAIAESGTIWAATGWSYRALYGSGVYATAVNSPLWARISGAISTQSVITLPTGNLVVSPTIWPGTFRVLSGTAGAINVIPKP